MELTPYPINPFASAISSGSGLLALALALKQRNDRMKFQSQPLGSALGYTPEQPKPTMVPAPGPVRGMSPGPLTPTMAPMNGMDGMMATPNLGFLGAPPQAQPLLGRSVADFVKLKDALGETQTTNLLASMGLGRGQADAMQLEYDEKSGTFNVRPGTGAVSARNANVILRQKDIASKQDLSKWREAVERRMAKAQLTREEALSLKADSDLLGFMLSPQFDLMDDTIKQQYEAQALAAVNRLQQRGVKVYTGSRSPGKTPPAAAPAPTPAPKPAFDAAARINQLKTEHPDWSDMQIYAQVAIEEAGQ